MPGHLLLSLTMLACDRDVRAAGLGIGLALPIASVVALLRWCIKLPAWGCCKLQPQYCSLNAAASPCEPVLLAAGLEVLQAQQRYWLQAEDCC